METSTSSLPASVDQLLAIPVEDLAGLILERLHSAERIQHVRNFATSIADRYPSEDLAKVMQVVQEAWQWLESHGMIAPDGQQLGWYFVTRQGHSIGTAANLKTHLARQRDLAAVAREQIGAIREQAATQIGAAIEDARKQAQDILQHARHEAASILNLARETAKGVSFDDVQQQFRAAAAQCLTGITIWAGLSAVSILSFLCVLIGFVTWWAPAFQSQTATGQSPSSGPAIYQTVIRVAILTAIGAVTTFCLRVLRAQMHLREQNLHRQRVANSIAAFLGAASPEQRDTILARMVDAVTSFGSSGLLTDGDESMSPAKVILESMPRTLPR